MLDNLPEKGGQLIIGGNKPSTPNKSLAVQAPPAAAKPPVSPAPGTVNPASPNTTANPSAVSPPTPGNPTNSAKVQPLQPQAPAKQAVPSPPPGQRQQQAQTPQPPAQTQVPAQTPQPSAKGDGLLDALGLGPGIQTITGSATPPPGSKPGPVPKPAVKQIPQPVAAPPGDTLSQIMLAVLKAGIHVTKPQPGSDVAKAMSDLARDCGIDQAQMLLLMEAQGRSVTARRTPLVGSGKAKGTYAAVTVSPAAGRPANLPDCLKGVVATKRMRLDLLVSGASFGPIRAIHLEFNKIAGQRMALNDAFNGTKSWRLPTALEFLAIMPTLYDESLYNSQAGKKFWTSTRTADGRQVAVVPGDSKRRYTTTLEALDPATEKAAPLWVRSP